MNHRFRTFVNAYASVMGRSNYRGYWFFLDACFLMGMGFEIYQLPRSLNLAAGP